MGPVATLVLAFMVLSLITKFTWEKIEFFLKSNIKYRIMDSLAAYIYYGDDIGVEASLKLDSPSSDIYQRRLVGQQYLASKLEATKPKDGVECHGKTLAASLVDCRFALAKVCMPLMRELEFSNAGRNFIAEVRNGSPHNDVNGTFNGSASAHDEGAAGILTVVTEDGVARPYVGNDAVHTLGVESFYAPIQKEVNRQMSLDDKENKESMMRYCPIAMNSALEKNVGLIKRLTGMDKVCSDAKLVAVHLCVHSLILQLLMMSLNVVDYLTLLRRSDMLSVDLKPLMPPSRTSKLPARTSHSLFVSHLHTTVTCPESLSSPATITSFFLSARKTVLTSSNVTTTALQL